MSNSVFKEYPISDGEDVEKADSNVVVFLNKDGSVSVDRDALQDLLTNDAIETNTSISVVRVGSPTPSLEQELNEAEELERAMADMSKDEDGSDKEETTAKQENDDGVDKTTDSDEKESTEKPPNVCLTIEDFYTPSQAKELASEILNIAGITNPLQLTIDYELRRLAIANDHCYTTLIGESPDDSENKHDESLSNKKTIHQRTMKKVVKHPTADDEDGDNDAGNILTGSDDEEIAEENESDYAGSSDFSPSESENDRDSDLDFNVNERNPRTAKKLKNRTLKAKLAGKLQKQRKRLQSTAELESMLEKGYDSDPNTMITNQSGQKKRVPSKMTKKLNPKSLAINTPAKQQNRILQINQNKPLTPTTVETISGTGSGTSSGIRILNQIVIRKPEIDRMINTTKGETIQNIPALAPISTNPEAKPITYIVRKPEVKKPAHVEALFSDMTTLFAKPDIMRKLNDKGPVSSTGSTSYTTTETSISTSTASKGYFMHLTPQTEKNVLPQLTVRTHLPGVSANVATLPLEQDKQLDLIDSIVQEELKIKSPPPAQPMHEDIPNIVKMLQNPDEICSNPITQTISFNRNDNQMGAQHPPNHMLDDSDILAGLTTEDGGLSEDLLQNIAKLVEDKNLQEVIDTQVLGVTAKSIDTIVQSVAGNNMNITQNRSIATPTAPLPETPSVTPAGKEPIKIVRSDGRVITLPPIEAPTTRAKRRAQANQQEPQTTPTTTKRGQAAAAASRATDVGDKSTKRDPRERRGSNVSRKVDGKTPDQSDYDDYDEDSQETNKSEDDPYRLWCICRQPHNNRFMICCDRCEDWFHGKCVNITKAMGVEMEKRGIEWVCPNCLKSQTVDIQPIIPTKKKGKTDIKTKMIKDVSTIKTGNDMSPVVTDVSKKLVQPVITIAATSTPKAVISTPKTVISTPNSATTTPKSVMSIQKLTNQPTLIIAKMPITTSVTIQQAVVNRSTFSKPVPSEVTSVVRAERPITHSIELDESPSLKCLVCNKVARPNSIYCSDDCIIKHAAQSTTTTATHQTSVTTYTGPVTKRFVKQSPPTVVVIQQQPKVEEIDLTKCIKSKNDRIVVYEPATGRCLAGPTAPKVANLQQWLKEHPTFELVRSGTVQAKAIQAKQQQLKELSKQIENQNQLFAVTTQQPKKFQATLKVDSSKRVIIVNPQQQNVATIGSNPKLSPKIMKKTPEVKTIQQKLPTMLKNQQTQPSQQQQSQKSRKTPVEQKPSPEKPREQPEPIRVNVRRLLREQLNQRMAEITNPEQPKLTAEEIDDFVRETEREIYLFFNKDTGTKYRAKYRSLMFNVKDRKNETLFEKICTKTIEPKQLVRMSPEEMASQELAKWRANETKHQLEMIKKSELDLLACNKNYVLKTHKGEEVIESKSVDRVALDPSVSVEDVVSVLNNSTVSSTSEPNTTEIITSPVPAIKDTRIDSRFEKYFGTADSSIKPIVSQPSSSGTSATSKSQHGKKERSRSRSRDRKKSSSSKHKRKRSRDRRDRSRDRSRERDRSRDRSRERDKSRDRKSRDEKSRRRDDDKKKDEKRFEGKSKLEPTSNKKIETKTVREKSGPTPKIESFNLIDKILEAQSTIDRILNPNEESKDSKPTTTSSSGSKKSLDIIDSMAKDRSLNSESDQEPTSTVTIPTPPEHMFSEEEEESTSSNSQQNEEMLWHGNINMIDVATFHIAAYPCSGDCESIKMDLPNEIDVVGRISPDSVWDYMYKIKKSINKEILILRLAGFTEEENIAYFALYTYLDTRKRLGVVKSTSPSIKDFYVVPLAAHKSLPSVLQPINGPGFKTDRQDMLLGIVVKITSAATTMLKRPNVSKIEVVPPKIPRRPENALNKMKKVVSCRVDDSSTPPVSPTITIALKPRQKPNVDKSAEISDVLDDGDEPYSPGGSDEDVYPVPSTSTQPMAALPSTFVPPQLTNEEDEMKRKMDELNRQIEAQKQEIAGILSHTDKSYASSAMPSLDKISIPSNLAEILNSIKNVQPSDVATKAVVNDPTTSIISTTVGDEYTPMSSVYRSATIDYKPASKISITIPSFNTKSTSRLAQLTDEELLSMVPDDAKLDSPPVKKVKYSTPIEPPPPGMEEEYVP